MHTDMTIMALASTDYSDDGTAMARAMVRMLRVKAASITRVILSFDELLKSTHMCRVGICCGWSVIARSGKNMVNDCDPHGAGISLLHHVI